MGKGDRRTTKGKRFTGSYGKSRPKAKAKPAKASVPAAASTKSKKSK